MGRPAAAFVLAPVLAAWAVDAGGSSSAFYGPGKEGNLALVTELEPSSFTFAKDGSLGHLVEFYAPWCPHCQHFKSEWGSVAALVKPLRCAGFGGDHGIRVAAVNCVEQKELCKQEGIHTYPAVKIFDGSGKTGVVVSERVAAKVVQQAVRQWHCAEGTDSNPVTAKALAGGDDGGGEAKDAQAQNTEKESGGGHFDVGGDATETQHRADREADLAEAVWFSLDQTIFAGRDTLNPEEGFALVHWLNLLADLLPADVLGLGSDDTDGDPDKFSLEEAANGVFDTEVLPLRRMVAPYASQGVNSRLDAEQWQALIMNCKRIIKTKHGRDVGQGSDWASSSCADVGGHTRGYTCGLWTLFHTLTVRAALHDSGYLQLGNSRRENAFKSDPVSATMAIYGYLTHFFACEECRDNFLKAHPEAQMEALVADTGQNDGRSLMLWWWATHNRVSARLQVESTERGDSDALFWHKPFPTKSKCGSNGCIDSNGKFIESGVAALLVREYSFDTRAMASCTPTSLGALQSSCVLAQPGVGALKTNMEDRPLGYLPPPPSPPPQLSPQTITAKEEDVPISSFGPPPPPPLKRVDSSDPAVQKTEEKQQEELETIAADLLRQKKNAWEYKGEAIDTDVNAQAPETSLSTPMGTFQHAAAAETEANAAEAANSGMQVRHR